MWERTWNALQQVVDDASRVICCFSDEFVICTQLLYSGTHAVTLSKSQTFSIEEYNAELRHYLLWPGH